MQVLSRRVGILTQADGYKPHHFPDTHQKAAAATTAADLEGQRGISLGKEGQELLFQLQCILANVVCVYRAM